MTFRLTPEEKAERAELRRSAREMAKKLAAAKEEGRYIVAYNQAQLDAAIAFVQASDECTPAPRVFLELRFGRFLFDGSTELELDQLLVTNFATVMFKRVGIRETDRGHMFEKIIDDDVCDCDR